jgi:hypothetical protein
MSSPSAKSPYAGYRFPPEVISHAVWLYFRFPLSLCMVEEMLAARGIIVSHETVGGSVFGLPWWGPPLGFTFPDLAFLPALLLCWVALCWGAGLGLPPATSLSRGVRQAAPYAVALLTLLYLGSAILASNANVQATRQMEATLTDELAVMEASR